VPSCLGTQAGCYWDGSHPGYGTQRVSSHELGEAITDPIAYCANGQAIGTAWFHPEIGDPCSQSATVVNGYNLQYLYSDCQKTCAVTGKCDCTKIGTDVNNCGFCGNACPTPGNGFPTCAKGICGFGCNAGYSACGNACVNLQTNTSNCGQCGNACPGGPGATTTCVTGTCHLSCNVRGYVWCTCTVSHCTTAAQCKVECGQ